MKLLFSSTVSSSSSSSSIEIASVFIANCTSPISVFSSDAKDICVKSLPAILSIASSIASSIYVLISFVLSVNKEAVCQILRLPALPHPPEYYCIFLYPELLFPESDSYQRIHHPNPYYLLQTD